MALGGGRPCVWATTHKIDQNDDRILNAYSGFNAIVNQAVYSAHHYSLTLAVRSLIVSRAVFRWSHRGYYQQCCHFRFTYRQFFRINEHGIGVQFSALRYSQITVAPGSRSPIISTKSLSRYSHSTGASYMYNIHVCYRDTCHSTYINAHKLSIRSHYIHEKHQQEICLCDVEQSCLKFC